MFSGLGRSPGEGHDNPLQYSGLENSMGCIWGHKESDATEQLFSLLLYLGFPAGAAVKNPPANTGDARDMGSIPGSGPPLPEVVDEKEKATHSTILLPGKLHGQRSLVGYSPWCCRVGHN